MPRRDEEVVEVNTDRQVRQLKPRADRYLHPVKDAPGLSVRVSPSGMKSYVVVARPRGGGAPVWKVLGDTDLRIEEARERASTARQRIKDGLSAVEKPPPAPKSFREVAGLYLEDVKRRGLLSAAEIERNLGLTPARPGKKKPVRYIPAAWDKLPFASIRRGDVNDLLRKIERNHGAVQADAVLAAVRQCMNWWQVQDEDYTSPIVRGMRRTSPTERARERKLDDDEIRLIWPLAESGGVFGAILRIALLTGQRREKLVTMEWEHVTADGVWRIAGVSRQKTTGVALLLPDSALTIIRAQKRIEGNPYVFAGRGKGHFNSWSYAQERFNERVLAAQRAAAVERGDDPDKVEPLPHWHRHDLRRTCDTLLARAGIPKEIRQRVLGHAVGGVEGRYNRHDYFDEKAAAVKALAGLLELILNPPADNVRRLHG